MNCSWCGVALPAGPDPLRAELDEIAAALPGTAYMDPPDGGATSIAEQVRRMAKDAARYRWLRTCHLGLHRDVERAFFKGDDALDAAVDEGLAIDAAARADR